MCLRRVLARPKLCGAVTKSLHRMSPGFKLAAARQASTGSSDSCQDCFQCTRQSVMKNKGYCEDTREGPVPPQAKRCSHRGTVHHHLLAIDKSNNFEALWTALLTLKQLFTCRQKFCSQAFQGTSTAYHRGMCQEDLDLGNALYPSEHAAEGSQPRQENNPACQLAAMSCKSSAGRLC